MKAPLETDRLLIRDWAEDDAAAALEIFGTEEVARWLTPALQRVGDLGVMRAVLQAWVETQPNMVPPSGRWAVVRRDDGEVVGGLVIRLLPPYEEDYEIGWQLRAVARPNNTRAVATAKRLGMEWVGETEKYYDLRLQVYRIRASELT